MEKVQPLYQKASVVGRSTLPGIRRSMAGAAAPKKPKRCGVAIFPEASQVSPISPEGEAPTCMNVIATVLGYANFVWRA